MFGRSGWSRLGVRDQIIGIVEHVVRPLIELRLKRPDVRFLRGGGFSGPLIRVGNRPQFFLSGLTLGEHFPHGFQAECQSGRDDLRCVVVAAQSLNRGCNRLPPREMVLSRLRQFLKRPLQLGHARLVARIRALQLPNALFRRGNSFGKRLQWGTQFLGRGNSFGLCRRARSGLSRCCFNGICCDGSVRRGARSVGSPLQHATLDQLARTPSDDLLAEFLPLADLAFEAAESGLQFLHLEFFQLQLQVERGAQRVFEFALMLGNRLPVRLGLPIGLELPNRRCFRCCGGLLSGKLLDQLLRGGGVRDGTDLTRIGSATTIVWLRGHQRFWHAITLLGECCRKRFRDSGPILRREIAN